MISYPNIKFPAQAALSRGLAMGFSVNASNFSDGYPCPATAGKIHVEFINGFGVAQLHGAKLSAQLPVVPLKHRKAPVTLTQTQDPAPSMADHAGRLEHQLLHHRLDAPALGCVAHWRVGLCQCVLPNQAQQIHRHRGELANQIVGVKLSARQALQIHIGLELRVKLLMRGVITVQLNHLGRTERLGQRRRPALQGVLRQQQCVAMLVGAALSQAVNPAHRAGLAADAVQRQRFLPQAFALTGALAHPLRSRIRRPLCRNGLHRRSARVPLDDEGDLAIKSARLCGDFLHQLQRTKARVRTHQQRRGHQAGGHRQGALKVVLALSGRVLHTRAQGQPQAVAQAPQVHRKRAVTINASVSATDQLFLGAAVVHRKGIEIHRGVAASQDSKVDGLPVDAAAKQRLIHLRGELKPRCRVRVHALAQGRARGNNAQAQRTLEEGVVSKALDRVKVAFTQTQQSEIAFENLAVGNPCAHRKLRIDQRIDVNALEVFADERQSGMGAEVVGQFLDNKIGHVGAHLLGEQYMRTKSLISIGKSTYFDL